MRRLLIRYIFGFFLLVGFSSGVLAKREDQHVKKAMESLAAGDTLAAIEQLDHADLENIRDPQLFILHGRLLRERGTIVGRLNSQHVLERAVQLFPDNPNVVQELGLTYFCQTFYPDAARAFLRALEIDPGLCDAMYKLGVTHYERWKLRVNAYMDEAASARRWLKAAVDCDPQNNDAATRQVYVLYALDRKDEAEKESRTGAARFPASPEFPLMAGTIAYEKQQFAVADSCYKIALSRMNEEELAAYTSLGRNLLGYDDMAIYEKASEDEQASIDHAFWVVRDFDPTTDVNERFLEHVYRTFRADLYFSHSSVHVTWIKPQTRGWDTERGEISIKFGWPSDIHASHGGDRFESWTYATFGQIHEFYFSDPFQNGKLQIPPNRSEKLVFARHQNRISRYTPEATIIDGAMDAVVFKNDEFTSSVYVTMQINADSLLNSVNVGKLKEFHARSRFFDEDWNVEKTTIDTIGVLDAAMISGSEHNLYDVVLHSELPFSNYNLACAFEDNNRAAVATFTGQCNAERFAGSDVQVSDLLYLRSVPGGVSIVRGDEVLPANPWKAYAPDQQLNVYFEIYNLDITGGQSLYRLSFEIHESPVEPPSAWNRFGRAVSRFVGIDDGRPAVAQTFERVGQSYNEHERIAIDISSLNEGRYRLIVTVTDLQNNEQDRISKIFYKTSNVEYAR